MNHIQVGDEFRNLLLEKTAWEKIDLDVDITDSADQGADVLEEAGNSEDYLLLFSILLLILMKTTKAMTKMMS